MPDTAFLTKKRKHHITVKTVKKADCKKWLSKQSKAVKAEAQESGFAGKDGHYVIGRDVNGKAQTLFAGVSDEVTFTNGAEICDFVSKNFGEKTLKSASFEFDTDGLSDEETERLQIGWGWELYDFDRYRKHKNNKKPALVLSKGANKKYIESNVASVYLTRDLVNTPANDMGPDELEKAAKDLAKAHEAKITVIKDKDLPKKNFPMVFEVGKASPRRPRLIDIRWGKAKDPKVTIVGKGVCFDTGGLDLKPSKAMFTMKKDMGGSAHALGVANMIMSMNLPINLRVLIPAVENSVSGEAYRPSDVLQSRKGITVEVGNTDAEGRLVLADSLTYACEEEPELLIDFATLTGAARVALGTDLPAIFSNREKNIDSIRKLSNKTEVFDPVWPLPLWKPYLDDLRSDCADTSSTGAGMGGAITAALFLEKFIEDKIEWIHIDCYAWEQGGKPGRSKGGADTGMRAIYALLAERYGK